MKYSQRPQSPSQGVRFHRETIRPDWGVAGHTQCSWWGFDAFITGGETSIVDRPRHPFVVAIDICHSSEVPMHRDLRTQLTKVIESIVVSRDNFQYSFHSFHASPVQPVFLVHRKHLWRLLSTFLALQTRQDASLCANSLHGLTLSVVSLDTSGDTLSYIRTKLFTAAWL